MDKQEIKKQLLKAVKNSPDLAVVRSVAIFGSYVNGAPSEDNDVDMLIDFEPAAVVGFFTLSDIKNSFESFLRKLVDLLTPQAISRYFRDECSCSIFMRNDRTYLAHIREAIESIEEYLKSALGT
ncbi:MAG: nucleotidyltransferase domain-containing protein [Phycisphaerae bacterium]|jgi:predicted nucleotidyltransferase